jgi:hypothetical protein
MKTLYRQKALEVWDEYWAALHQEWFKLEVLQDYSVEDDCGSLRAWKKGDRIGARELLLAEDLGEWGSMCKEKRHAGVTLCRYHIVEKPISQYLAWELMVYEIQNIAQCGERVSLIDKKAVQDLVIPSGDMMIFDGKEVIINQYNKEGRMVAADIYDESDDIGRFLDLKSSIEKRSQLFGGIL